MSQSPITTISWVAGALFVSPATTGGTVSTTNQVWQYMLNYQEEHEGMPPKMDEIQAAHPDLAWRSSVRYTIQTLVGDGRVVETDEPGTARRYRAVPKRAGMDLRAEAERMPVSLPVMIVPLEVS